MRHVPTRPSLRTTFACQGIWQPRKSIEVIKKLMGDRMFPATIEGLERAMKALAK